MDALIPGLPDEIGRECLARVPYNIFPAVRSVSKLWREEVDSPDFHRFRKAGGLSRTVVALAQIEPSPPRPAADKSSSPAAIAYRLALFEPATGSWAAPPPAPDLPRGLPLFCRIAAAGRSLVVVGGWDPATWAASDAVFVYDFATGAWRRGARMPGPRRSFFACASDSDQTVFVAGGHDEDKNALRSALAYDVAGDRWAPLPDMAEERDECTGVFLAGVFHVIGGYPTESQGQFRRSSEAFDVAASRWSPVQEDTVAAATCPASCVAVEDAKLYNCRDGRVEVQEEGSTWRAVADLPKDVRVVSCVLPWKGEKKLLVVGSAGHGRPLVRRVLELGDGREGHKWGVEVAAVPEEYSGHVQAGCSLEI